MSYFRIQTTVKRPGKDPNRKNARRETKIYQYVYEITSRRGRVKGAQKRTKRRKYKAIVHDIKRCLGSYKKLDQVKKNEFSVLSHLSLDKNGIIKEAIKANLLAHGFTKTSEGLFEYPGVVVNLKDMSIKGPGKSEDIVLGIYAGLLCPLTIKRILDFELHHKDEFQEFARYIQEMGLLPNEIVEIPQKEEQEFTQVDGLIQNMERIMGEEKRDKKQEEQDEGLIEMIKHNRLFMEVLAKKSPMYKKQQEEARLTEIKEEKERKKNTMSLEQFRKEKGY